MSLVVTLICLPRQSCENIRLALERLKPENELESFVRDYCTGNAATPEPLEFVSHANTDAPSVSVNRASALPQDDATGTHIDGCLPISSYGACSSLFLGIGTR